MTRNQLHGTEELDLTQHDGPYRIDLKEIGRRASQVAEREAILDMLVRTLGRKKETAQRLGISYKALLYKIRDFGIAGWRPRTSRVEFAKESLLARE